MAQERDRAALHAEAVARASASGLVWNDLDGKTRDSMVQAVEREWAAEATQAEVVEKKARTKSSDAAE